MKQTFVSKTDLAVAYFPHLSPDSARHKLMSLISDKSTKIMERLRSIGYRDLQKDLSPAQVSIITDYLGNPFK